MADKHTKAVKIYCTEDGTVGYGRTTIPDVHTIVYSVATEEEAKMLRVMACKLNYVGNYFSPEVAAEGLTTSSLQDFSDRLASMDARVQANKNR